MALKHLKIFGNYVLIFSLMCISVKTANIITFFGNSIYKIITTEPLVYLQQP
jgi:hypothetical protein